MTDSVHSGLDGPQGPENYEKAMRRIRNEVSLNRGTNTDAEESFVIDLEKVLDHSESLQAKVTALLRVVRELECAPELSGHLAVVAVVQAARDFDNYAEVANA